MLQLDSGIQIMIVLVWVSEVQKSWSKLARLNLALKFIITVFRSRGTNWFYLPRYIPINTSVGIKSFRISFSLPRAMTNPDTATLLVSSRADRRLCKTGDSNFNGVQELSLEEDSRSIIQVLIETSHFCMRMVHRYLLYWL